MSAQDGGPAQTDLTVLDYFATEAMKEMLKTYDQKRLAQVTDFSAFTDKAYLIGTFMIESRKPYT